MSRLKMEINNPMPFEEIVSTYQREIINFHYRFVRSRFEAEDLAQETFVKAYFNLKKLQEPAKLKSWLYQIARNTVIDYFRKNKKSRNDVSLDHNILENFAETASEDSHKYAMDAETSKELQKCLDLLVSDDQRIVKLLYYDGFSYNEISQLLAINQNTLKSRLHRARKILAEAIRSNKVLRDLAVTFR